jgi:hypothetical protein
MIQRAVVDSNMLQAPVLRAWLADGSGNVAVLPDYLWLEIYKQQTVAGLEAAFSVIQDFPDRLAVLKPSGELAGLDPSHSDLVERMLRPGVASEMRMMVEAISLAQQGEPEVMAQLQEKWSSAAAHMDGMLEGAADIIQSLPEIAEAFSADEIRRCRTNGQYTMAMFETVFGAADQLYETFLESCDVTPGHLSPEHRYDAYLYRLALAVMIYALWWIRSGSQLPKRLDRARNDFIDLGFAVYGTYFAGLITEDAKARWMHDNLSAALRMIGARQGLEMAGSSPNPPQ